MTDTISKITTVYESNGADKAAADFARVTKAQDGLAQSSIKVSQTNETLSRSTISVQRQIQGFAKANDDLTKAEERAAQGARLMAAAQREGLEITEGQARALANAQARVAELRAAVEGHTASVGLNRNQILESVHVMKSFADQVIAGQSPLRALAVEGGRIGQIFTSGSGGVLGTFKAIGAELSGIVDPAVLAAGAIAGVGIAAAGAALAWEEGQSKLAASLEGTGRAAGSTLAQLNAIAEAGARAGRISSAQGRELAGDFAHVGISASQSQALIGSAPAFSRLTGEDIAATGKSLAQAFADPEKGATELNQSLGFLNDRILTSIHNLEAAGNMEAARATLFSAYNRSLSDITDRTWTLSRVFDQAKVNVSNFFSDFGREATRTFGGQNAGQELESLRGRLPFTSNRLPGYFNTDFVSKEIDRLQAIVDQQAKTATVDAVRKKAEADANTLSLQARDIIRGILPELERNESFGTRSGVLQRVIANPSGLSGVGDASRALGLLTAQHAFSDPFVVMQQDAKLALDAVNATSLAQRAAVEARRAELAVMRETGDVSRAASAAQNAMNVEIARANKAAEDQLRTSRQNAAMVGLTPIERQLAEIDNRYADLRRTNVSSGKDFTTALVPVQADFRSAGQLIVDALRDAASAIRGASPYGTLGGVRGSSTYADAIKAVESSGGNYGALGPVTKSGDRAYGAYQVMGANIPSWTRDALGFSMTPSQFLADRNAQDSVFNHQFGSSLTKYGNANDAASVWFTGRPLAQGAGARDVLGTTGAGYVGKFDAALGGGSALTVTPSVALTANADYATSRGVERSTAVSGGITDRLADANRDLDARNKLLAVEQSTVGQTAVQIQAAAQAQQMLNSFSAQGFDKLGPDVWRQITDGVQSYHASLLQTLTAEQRFQEQQQRVISAMDDVRSVGHEAMSTIAADLRNGASGGKILTDVMGVFEQKLLDIAMNQMITSLFGKAGTAGGGAFGSFFSSLFSGGGSVAAAVHHTGGIVGRDGTPRYAPMSAFVGAPRFHSGMGLAHDERPAILQTGEAVVSRQDLADARRAKTAVQQGGGSQGGGQQAAPIITNHYAEGTSGTTTVTRGRNHQVMIKNVIVSTMMDDLQGRGKFSRALSSRTGTGRTGGS